MNIEKVIHSRLFVIILIVILIFMVIITGTYAWFTWNSTENTELTMTIGKLADVTFTSGNDINTGLTPVYNYYDGEKTTFSINNRNNSGDMAIYKINFNITSIDTELISDQVKYVLVKNGDLIRKGNLSNISSGSTIELETATMATGITSYEFYLYLDGNEENDRAMIGKTIVGNIMLEGSESSNVLVEHLSNLYSSSSKNVVTNNNIEYNYATSASLMNDRLGGTTSDYNVGNIRYYGASPNNYIYFNCSDYSNQSSDTCELWRIIGVFDGKVKIIRNESIGNYSWDNKNTSTGAESAYGKNDWTTARLMKLLNPSNYYTVDANDNGYGQSLYYNSQSGTCFSGLNNATTSCDFTSTGLKNDTTRNMIEEVTWNLGGWNSSGIYSDQIYTYERGTTIYTGRPTSWTGKIALMYPSDYGYATDFSKCSKTMSDYSSSDDPYACRTNDWLYNSAFQWSLTPNSSNANFAWYLHSAGIVNAGNRVYVASGVRPVLYLNSVLAIESGDGSSSTPYRLSVS